MRHTTSLITTTEALRRVFLASFQSSPLIILCTVHKTFHSSPQGFIHPRRSTFHSQQRHYAAGISKGLGGKVVQNHSPNGFYGQETRLRPNRAPRDEEIEAYRIHLVIPKTGKLSESLPLLDVLDSRKKDDKGRPTEYLQEVAPPNPDQGLHYPICKIFDKKQVRESQLAMKKVQKESKKQTKQLEISWTVDDHDLGHRLARLKEFLEKGWKVEILFGVKRKGWTGRREPTEDDVKRVLERIVGTVREVDGAKEWKPMQGQLGGQAVLAYEGKAKK